MKDEELNLEEIETSFSLGGVITNGPVYMCERVGQGREGVEL